jgi:thiol-disulfide isomerase/thioredoxin
MQKILARKIVTVTLLVMFMAVPELVQAVPQKGKQLPPFSAETVSGKRISPADYRGKVLLLAITTDGCNACNKAIPGLTELSRQYEKEGVQLLGLHYGARLGMENLKMMMALTDEKTVRDTLGIYGSPCYVLLNKKGVVVGFYRGYNDVIRKVIEQQLKVALAE